MGAGAAFGRARNPAGGKLREVGLALDKLVASAFAWGMRRGRVAGRGEQAVSEREGTVRSRGCWGKQSWVLGQDPRGSTERWEIGRTGFAPGPTEGHPPWECGVLAIRDRRRVVRNPLRRTGSQRLAVLRGTLERVRAPVPESDEVVADPLRRVRRRQRIATWLILPVVICLSQRLSHACVSINSFVL